MIEAVLLLILISITLDYLKSSNYDALTKRALTTATLFATTTKDGVLSYDLASLEAFVSEVLKNPDLKYARVLGPQAQLFASGGDKDALSKEFFQDLKVEDVDDGTYDTFALINEAGINYGKVEIGLDIAPILETISEAQYRSVVIGFSEMVLVALFSLILGGYLTRQLELLKQATKSIEKGDLNVVVPVRGRDEIANVAKAFNSMAKSLRAINNKRDKAEKELQELNLSLEERVILRTTQLESRNRQLLAANQEIKATQAQLLQSEKMASLGVLVAGVAHEINNPMSFVISNVTVLQGYLSCYQWLLQHYRMLEAETDQEKRTDLIQRIKKCEVDNDISFIEQDIIGLINEIQEGSLRTKEIVKSLKEFSHLEQQQKFELYDVNKCIESTLKMINSQLASRCKVIVDLNPLPLSLIEVGKINQVLMNILINSYQAIKGSGTIRISSKVVEDNICVHICDDGKGIHPDTISNIFDPFYTTKQVGEGTGLGLSISYSIIDEHHGYIHVKSKENISTCFTIELPITPE
ncbi:MAG: PAS protein [Osedax symbiont Rs2]|nr:MAG: PAS protein [Osedax symbiont Rs2]